MKKIFLFLLIFIFLLFIGLLINYQFFIQPKISLNQIENKELITNSQEEKIKEKFLRWVDGIEVEKEKANLLPIAVVLENFLGAPKPDFSSVSIIYEVPVEGGLTRFLAIFDLENLPDNLGPIRSARPYFAEIAEEYKPLFIHAGGSPEVLLKLKQGFYKLFNLDEISWMGRYFYRSSESSPHNLYIKKESVKEFLTDQKINQEAKFEPWFFNEKIKEGEGKTEIKIIFSPLYQVSWQYDKESNEYQYWQNNLLYRDKKNQELRVKNLILQYTEIIVIDSEGRKKIRLNGQGRAMIFQNGQVIKGKWLKEGGRTKFYDENGNKITLLPGKTWIGIVSDKMTR